MNTSAPGRHEFPEVDDLGALVSNLREVLGALPVHFRTVTQIEGLDAGELFNLDTVFGSVIEKQVVETLNRNRKVWDPGDRWPRYRFVRSAQTFPDVRLQAFGQDGLKDIILGIELKGWYLLSREGEPSFRYSVTPDACDVQDLLVVVPWHLKNVLSGEPAVHEPYLEQARYVAKYRNWWWTNVRRTGDTLSERQVKAPDKKVSPYPAPKTKIADRAFKDGGNNFGRVARIERLMNDYTSSLRERSITGIPAENWIAFFKNHVESEDTKEILAQMTRD